MSPICPTNVCVCHQFVPLMSVFYNFLQPLDTYQTLSPLSISVCEWCPRRRSVAAETCSNRCNIQAISIGLVYIVVGMECLYVARVVSAKACVWLAATRWILQTNTGSWCGADNPLPYEALNMTCTCVLPLISTRGPRAFVHVHVPCNVSLERKGCTISMFAINR